MARQEIRSYDYVNRPYALVRDALAADPGTIFRDATRAAADRARTVAGALRVSVAGIDVAAEVVFRIGAIAEEQREGVGGPVTRIPVSWQAAVHPQWFPSMDGVLAVYPLTASETQLDFHGHYAPPLGVVGSAMDALVGHRIAEASVHRFIADLARHLRASA